MATPDFVLALREKIGHAPLWLTGVTAVIIEGTRILLIRRSDNGQWTPVTGIVDPGEHPAVAAAREALEEANVVVRVEALAWVGVTEQITYDNGDQSQYIDLTFRCDYVDGDAFPADGEASEVGWFAIDALPPMSTQMRARIRHALAASDEPRFSL